MTGIFIRREIWRLRHTQGRRPCKDGSRNWIYAVTSQEMPDSWKLPEPRRKQGRIHS